MRIALKRVLLVILVLAGPALATALLSWAAGALLTATNRVIDPTIVRLAAMIEFAAFSFVAVLEAKDRWSAETQ
jgi:putative Ca2+/H+ antiporter (TMEM165/GDT1 family)